MTVNINNCDQEPIHIPGSIQPHGYLLGVDETSWTIQVISANVQEKFGRKDLIGQKLDTFLVAESIQGLRDCLEKTQNPTMCGPVHMRSHLHSMPMQAMLHRSSGLLIVELEEVTDRDHPLFEDYHVRLRTTIGRMSETDGIEAMCQHATREIKHLTGFDRVMFYRFDPEWNGQVIAESKEEYLETFLGLHYPHSDIPAQARHLYTINWLRLIADRDYIPSPLMPALHPKTGGAIDLSHSVLRSVSPIHLQYLRNMGVEASMSVSVLQDGKLWGLIACHHYAPKRVSFDIRIACESLAQILSWQISALERSEYNSQRAAAGLAMSDILTSAANERTLVQGLLKRSSDLLQLVDAQGVAIHYSQQLVTAGLTPSEDAIRDLIQWLKTQHAQDVFATHRLWQEYPAAADFTETGAGILAIHLLSSSDDYIIWFRPEQVETVNWAGNPNKEKDVNSDRLSPRGSFALWQQTVHGQSIIWRDWQKDVASRFLYVLVASLVKKAEEIDKLNRELQYASQAKDEFLAMVSHELRTPLNSMIGWMQMIRGNLLHESEYPDAYQTIERNAYDQLQLIEDLIDISRIVSGKMQIHPDVIEVNTVLHNAVNAVKPAIQSKEIRLIVLDAPTVSVYGDADRLQQVLWNLLNNAVKFTPKHGLIEVGIREENSDVRIHIQDSGQGIAPDLLPYIFDRFRQGDNSMARQHLGLGLGLAICRHLIELHGGRIQASSEGRDKGSRFEMSLPASPLTKEKVARDKFPATERLECPPELRERTILVVDDEGAARQVLSLVFERLNLRFEVASSGEEALEKLRTGRFNLLVSDIGMPGMDGFEFIERLRELPDLDSTQLPAIALSAYTRGQDKTRAFRAGFQAHVSKPVDIKELLSVMASLCKLR